MASPDITLYTSPTANGAKISIVLEELGLPYRAQAVDLARNEQKEEWFLKFNPNGRLPAITDGKQRVCESGAIMLYLVEKYDKKRKISYGPGSPEYGEQLGWLIWQMGGLGPMQGQAHHFTAFAPIRSDYGIQRYTDEAKRLYSVLDKRLQESPYLAGEKFTVADIASFAWMRISPDCLHFDLAEWPAVKKWHDTILRREALPKALKVPWWGKMSEEWFAQLVTRKRQEMMARDNTDKY